MYYPVVEDWYDKAGYVGWCSSRYVVDDPVFRQIGVPTPPRVGSICRIVIFLRCQST